jgi:hypothetical protein
MFLLASYLLNIPVIARFIVPVTPFDDTFRPEFTLLAVFVTALNALLALLIDPLDP